MKRRRFFKATLGMALVAAVPLNIPGKDNWYKGKLCATNWPGAEYDERLMRQITDMAAVPNRPADEVVEEIIRPFKGENHGKQRHSSTAG